MYTVPQLCEKCYLPKERLYSFGSVCDCSFGPPATNENPPVVLTGGTKHDTGKPQLSLIPVTALESEAKVFAYGKAKYGLNNYKKGFTYSRLIDAALRHIHAFNSGESDDPETHESHLAHARCCLAILIDTIALGTATDDRYKKP